MLCSLPNYEDNIVSKYNDTENREEKRERDKENFENSTSSSK